MISSHGFEMPKTCIICGKRAGSGEHVFPAVLGGRRTNRGIFCHDHNQGFSPLAKIIGEQLKPINALLAIRPDHSDKAEPFDYTSPEGDRLVIFDGQVRRASSNAPESDTALHVRLLLGGDDGLKAVTYIALTFFAHHFQQHARKPGLQPIKDYLLSTGQNEFVWWESETILASLPPNPFAFGHTIVLETSAATGEATAFVSFFGSLTFGLALAQEQGLTDHTVVVFVDPQADHPPHDIQSTKNDVMLLNLRKPAPLHAHLAKNVSEGAGQNSLQRLIERIEEWKFGKEMTPVLERLNTLRTLPPSDLRAAVSKIVQEQVDRVYWLMRYLADDFKATQNGPAAKHLVPTLAAMVTVNLPPVPTLNRQGERVILASIDAVVNDLAANLARSEIDMDYLFRLLHGGHGAGIVGEIMFDTAMEAISD
jgi:hypothetical protein